MAEDFFNKGFLVWLKSVDIEITGKGMELVMTVIGILAPVLGMARHVFGIDISQQNLGLGFVFNDKNSMGFKKHSFWNLLPDNKASSPLLLAPSGQVLALS